MKFFVPFLFLFVCTTFVRAQLTEYATTGKGWIPYSELSTLGFSKASLQYVVNENDTTFLLQMYDQRPELKSYFSVKFRREGNTLHSLYEILTSVFEKENWRNREYIRVFRLGDDKVSVYRSPVIESKAVVFSTDKGRIQFNRREIDKLFKKE